MELDSIIAIVAAIAIGIFQLVSSANKKKRAREAAMRPQIDSYIADYEIETEESEELERVVEMPEEEPIIAQKVPLIRRMMRPEEEGGPMNKPISAIEEGEIKGVEATASEEDTSLLLDFTPQKAIIYAEILNPRWNS